MACKTGDGYAAFIRFLVVYCTSKACFNLLKMTFRERKITQWRKAHEMDIEVEGPGPLRVLTDNSPLLLIVIKAFRSLAEDESRNFCWSLFIEFQGGRN
jgi:hypothetical protein